MSSENANKYSIKVDRKQKGGVVEEWLQCRVMMRRETEKKAD